jgi:protein involved in sex pheromone biosynthesis
MRMIALAALALALSACGSNNDSTANEANALTADNLLMDENLLLDSNVSTNTAPAVDLNETANASTAELKAKDATTNDPDTNLANGL